MGKSVSITQHSVSYTLASRVRDYFILTKFTLSFLVVFSSVVCYLMAPNISWSFLPVFILFVAGLLITGAANAINQAAEKDTDKLMMRTASRPVAAGRLTPNEAYVFAGLCGAAGLGLMWYFFNFNSAFVSLLSLFIYGFIYTPLKRVNSISVLVGALPGALPCLIGWVAGTGLISPFATFDVLHANGHIETYSNFGGYFLFAIQFLWQFPHFWAIAWLAHRDYDKAGFKLLPSKKGPTRFTAVQCVIYSMLMVPVGMLPMFFGMSGMVAFWLVLMANVGMVIVSFLLLIKMTAGAARRVMFASYFYLMIVYLSLLLDKI